MSSTKGSTPLSRLLAQSLSSLAQFNQLGESEYLERAISYQKEALSLAPKGHPSRPIVLDSIATMLLDRFKLHGDLKDLNKAIAQSIQAASTCREYLISPGLNNLGIMYATRFLRSRRPEDLERSLHFKAQAISWANPGSEYLPSVFNEIGISFHMRFQHLKKIQDIDHAIIYQKQSLVGTRRHENYPTFLMNLGRAFRDRFQHLDKREDIDNSILCLRRAVKLVPHSRVVLKAMCLNNLASALGDRFDHLGELADLDESIQIVNDAVLCSPDEHPEKCSSLNNLGYYLEKRFERLKEVDDINQAISYQRQSVSLSPMIRASHPEWHLNLGNSLMSRFTLLNDLADLDESIYHMENVLQSANISERLRSRALNNLGNSLLQRFFSEKKLEDIDASINHLKEAISATRDDDSHKARWLGNLGISYTARFGQLNQIYDLDNAIQCRNHANSLIPEGHIYKCGILHSLGDSYRHRYLILNRPRDLLLGIKAYHEAALLPSGEPSIRFGAALMCARSSMDLDRTYALKHYEMAMNLLSSVVWLGTTIQRRYKDVPGTATAATEAAAAAIEFQEYGLALEWLEQGRSIVWQQILNLRMPFDELKQINPTLASRLQDITWQLDIISMAQTTSSGLPNDKPVSEEDAQKHRRLAEEWERMLEEVRCIPNFHDFMRPRRSTELVQAARLGAVVVINVHRTRCDALVLRSNSQAITHIPLPDFSLGKANTAYEALIGSLHHNGVRERGIRPKQPQQGDMFENILSLLWSDVVQPVLESLDFTVCTYHLCLTLGFYLTFRYQQTAPTNDLPHITWCTTGPLAFLPLHAAGCYSEPKSRVYHYATSSYTPTLNALLASTHGNNKDEFRGILGVGQASTPGFNPLPGTAQELNRIKKQARDFHYTQLDGELATVNAVLGAMENHDWIHLACHASQSTSDPTASAFHLYDGTLSLADIMKKSFKNAGLAFLSACQTAKGDADLPDEAVHLAAGMLMAGFPAVIATMWSIRDEDGPLIAEEVYAVLMEGGKPDSRQAAQALHKAVGRLREEVGEKAFTLWVPYIHLGN